MLLTTLLVATLSSVPSLPATASADPSVSITTAFVETQGAAQSEAAASLGTPSKLAIGGGVLTKALAAANLAYGHGPFDGAAATEASRGKEIAATIVAFAVGFGIGHAIIKDSNFTMFLIIDIAIVASAIVLGIVLAPIAYVGYIVPTLLWLAKIGSQVWQGLDVLGKVTGDPIVRHVRESQIRIANAPGTSEHPLTTRAFAISF